MVVTEEMPRPLWTVREAAHYLKLKPGTVYELVERGRIPHVRIGRSIRFDADALVRFLGSVEA